MSAESYPYTCDIKIPFPATKQADIALQVMQVDQEVGNRARKTLRIDPQDSKNLLV